MTKYEFECLSCKTRKDLNHNEMLDFVELLKCPFCGNEDFVIYKISEIN